MASMTVQFLDVGQGDGTAVVMRSSDNLDDPGELALVDFGEKRTPSKVPYLDAMTYLVALIDSNSSRRPGLKFPYVDILFLTHPDPDHYNKVAELAGKKFNSFPNEQLRFGRIVFGGNQSEYGDLITDLYDGGRGVVDNLPKPLDNKQHAQNASLTPVPDWTFAGGSVNVYLLSSNYPTRSAAAPNPKSLVLLFKCGSQKVILQGDAEANVEKYIANEFSMLFLASPAALKLGHHGSKFASSPDWLFVLKPRGIFASGDMRWAHPYCEPICRAIEAGGLRPVGPTGPETVWYCCGAGHGQNREYFNNPTKNAVCMNLWYVVKNDEEELLYDAAGDGQTWTKITERKGLTFGVQWQLDLPTGSDWEFGVTGNAVPDPDSDEMRSAPFDCSTVGDEFVFVPSPEPARTP